VQVDQDQYGNGLRVTIRERLLTKGCHEIQGAWMGVFSTKNANTKRNLTREMAKPVEHNADSHHGMCWLGGGS